MIAKRSFLALALFATVTVGGAAAGPDRWVVESRGEAAVIATAGEDAARFLDTEIRYLPELMLTGRLGGGHDLDVLAACDLGWNQRFRSLDEVRSEADAQTTRLWMRYLAPRGELRVGRQKLSFGSAAVLRPLMWFDNIDPRDPLGVQPGVDAALARLFLFESFNLWLWGVRGTDGPRGWSVAGTPDEEPEYGGRMQWPLGNGELAATFHTRRAAFEFPAGPLPGATVRRNVRERRYALDGKWDVTLGLWFEAVLVHQDDDLLPAPYRRFATAGLDYTFDWGQGLTVLAEHLVLGTGGEPWDDSPLSDFSAATVNLPWGVVDEFRLLTYRDWERSDSYWFGEWRRRYDHWSWHWTVFANPDSAAPNPLFPEAEQLRGWGGRVALIFNH